MEENNKNNDISNSKQENKIINDTNDINIDNEKEKVKEKDTFKLPKIQKEHIPLQLNKTNHSKYEKDTFLTSKNIEKEKLRISNEYISNLSNENKLIFDLLKQKINISKPSPEKIYKSNNNLMAYMNEATVYRNSHFRKREVKNLRKVKISSLITTPINTYKKISKDKNNLSVNKKTIDSRLFEDLYKNNNFRRLRTIDKKGIKHDTFDHIPSNWRKNRNCALKYKFNKNKDSIDVVSSVLQDLGQKIKVSFDVFKNETENNFDDFMYDNEKIDF